MTTNTTKIALVTGASWGLGRNMAIALGRNIVVAERDLPIRSSAAADLRKPFQDGGVGGEVFAHLDCYRGCSATCMAPPAPGSP